MIEVESGSLANPTPDLEKDQPQLTGASAGA